MANARPELDYHKSMIAKGLEQILFDTSARMGKLMNSYQAVEYSLHHRGNTYPPKRTPLLAG